MFELKTSVASPFFQEAHRKYSITEVKRRLEQDVNRFSCGMCSVLDRSAIEQAVRRRALGIERRGKLIIRRYCLFNELD